ncbi:quinolinate synthase NadA [Celerinatantimonas yamalensis]|uniref:Quinolinate synthase n=1 Tax=Celerinatantimonas yamalensis TaxID=559956 RepID=A0ABW9GB99_9GAMM
MALADIINTHAAGMPEHYKYRQESEMIDQVRDIKHALGERLFIPAHHYQKDEVFQFADAIGDSLQLAQLASANHQARYIVFCGVHFMAETADMLTQVEQTVVLPDMRAGCTMADMANLTQLNQAWEHLQLRYGDTILPLTYVNSTAEIKAFVGRHGGATVTSSNAQRILRWALAQKKRVLFLPDQHLGRNSAYALGIPLAQMAIWSPTENRLLNQPHSDLKIILWQGHCSVHEKFSLENIKQIRQDAPETRIIVHPECSHEVVTAADYSGSTKFIIETITQAPPHTQWAIGTEMNLVNRLAQQHPDKPIRSLNPNMCPCLTMNRIDLPHLVWSLEQIEANDPVGVIQVPAQVSEQARQALTRMLTI